MGNTIRVTYTRKFTNKRGDNFEHVEVGGAAEVDLGEIAGADDLVGAWNQLHDEFVAAVEAKALEDAEGTVGAPVTQDEAPDKGGDKLSRWVKKTVNEETDRIRSRTESSGSRTLPGERFAKGAPQKKEPEVSTATITEGEAVSFDGVRVFLDNSQTKIGKTQRGKKYGMLRLGKRGEIPGDYVTGKSFEPDIVEDIEAIIEEEIKDVNVYGYFEARNNDPEVFDLVIQGIEPA